jgi:putative phosphoserine phosphatase / 1-acylglycerol-3-phosphate O-acyltransferase
VATYEELTAEIEQSPKGAHVAAIFDLDGTLVAGRTSDALLLDRLRHNQIPPSTLVWLLGLYADHRLNRTESGQLFVRGMGILGGAEEDAIRESCRRLYGSRISRQVYPETRDLVEAHRRQGHTVVLATSASRYQAEPIAEDLGVAHVLCSELEVEGGKLTGKLTRNLWGEGKLDAVLGWAAEANIDLAQSWFYANGDEDVHLLERVGHPRALNPDGKLAAIARQRGWPTAAWSSRGGIASPVTVSRTVAAMASAVPSFAAAVPAGVLNWDRRMIFELGSGTWGDFAAAISGVTLNVLGRENLWKQRPAVFVINHQSTLDGIVAMKLFRDGKYTLVMKKEVANFPLFGQLFKLADPVFIDRQNTQSAIEALQPAVERVKQGYSVCIAPEGHRSPGRTVQTFKKGAFRVAMAAHAPIVPVVIRNAGDLMPRRSMLIRPGTVDVCVLPPISVEGWTHDDLDERIEGVRQLFTGTLENWPGRDA